MIHTSLSPNTTLKDLAIALYWLAAPWKWLHWKTGSQLETLERLFRHIVNAKHAISFRSGRDALYVALKSVGVQNGDEVILQPYTCIVVPHAILKLSATPVYADVDEKNFTINPLDVEKKITPKTKAIIVQHTFGHAADVQKLQALCQRHNLKLIEDCAHTVGGQCQGQLLGSFGDVAMWSFGRDKVISGTWGGMLTTNSDPVAAIARQIQSDTHSHYILAFQSLLHPLLFAIAKPLYSVGIGKLLIVISQKFALINKAIHACEKSIEKMDCYHPERMNNANAALIIPQLRRLNDSNWHRKSIVDTYQNALSKQPNITLPSIEDDQPLLRYTILVKNAHQIHKSLLKQGIQLGDWYHHILEPPVDESKFYYIKGSCPNAESLCPRTLNLPTHIQMSERKATHLIQCLTLSMEQVRVK